MNCRDQKSEIGSNQKSNCQIKLSLSKSWYMTLLNPLVGRFSQPHIQKSVPAGGGLHWKLQHAAGWSQLQMPIV